jgi:hypothetical protein
LDVNEQFDIYQWAAELDYVKVIGRIDTVQQGLIKLVSNLITLLSLRIYPLRTPNDVLYASKQFRQSIGNNCHVSPDPIPYPALNRALPDIGRSDSKIRLFKYFEKARNYSNG